MPSRRLLLAFAASLALHAALLGGSAWLAGRHALPPPVTPALLEAVLLRPQAAEPLLKDTLAREAGPPTAAPPPSAGARPGARSERAARRKLAEHLYYPPEAIARGLEGEVRLLLTLAADGRIVDVQVAGSSGHPLLDRAAVRAALAMGVLPGMERPEIILPVVFQLRP